MKQKEYITKNFQETKKLGESIAKEILNPVRNSGDKEISQKEDISNGVKNKSKNKNAFVIGLKGELGGGKTTFLQGFAKGLNIKEKILSTTFVIFKKFKIQNNNNLYHFDCYRIHGQKDLLDLGFKEIVSNLKNIVVVEWADKIKKIMPKNSIWIEFKVVDENKRKIIIKKT